ncbi:unnamed protein product, partial [Ectocarpus fasciculatus]
YTREGYRKPPPPPPNRPQRTQGFAGVDALARALFGFVASFVVSGCTRCSVQTFHDLFRTQNHILFLCYKYCRCVLYHVIALVLAPAPPLLSRLYAVLGTGMIFRWLLFWCWFLLKQNGGVPCCRLVANGELRRALRTHKQ